MLTSKLTKALAASAIALGLTAIAAPSQAAVVLFASYNTGNSNAANFRFVNGGAADPDSAVLYTTSTASATSAGASNVRFSFFDDPAIPDFQNLAAKFTLNGTVKDTPAQFDGTTYTQQGVDGSFKFVYSGPTTVIDGKSLVQNSSVLFSGTFTNAWIQGRGGVGGVDVTIGNGGSAVFASNYYNLSLFNPTTDEYTFHLGAVSPNFSQANSGSALKTFRAHVAGDFQAAAAVPEPATWALMIGGFGGAGAMLRRRKAVAAAA